MDPARKAMIQSGRRSPPRRDIASPRNDPNTRISKPTNPPPSARSRQNKTSPSAYMTQDEQARKFVAEEDKFVLKQTKKKADIRVREGRAKPIDLLAYNLRFVDDDRDLFDEDEADLHVALTAPDVVLQSLDESQLRELEADIKSYHTLETNSRNREYWLSLQTICSERRQKLEPQGPDDRVVSAVSSDVDKILSPKTYEQLEALEKQVKAKLQSNEDIDTDYWEQLLRSLLVWKAKAKLKKVYEAVKESRAAMLNARHPNKAHSSSDVVPGLGGASSLVRTSTGAESSSRFDIKAPVKSIIPSSAPPGTARFAQVENEDFSQATKALYEREVARGVGEDEEVFAAEEAVTATAKPQWADKHRPRKPRYFNRVQMGYEWNKYNQTHYDHDNPPPKVVQGYKFNIFYPELIDKTKAPTFKIIREHGRKRGESFAPAGEEDTCLIRFIAGPPYEDIAFRIVDREWDYSAKKDRGFKSSFDKEYFEASWAQPPNRLLARLSTSTTGLCFSLLPPSPFCSMSMLIRHTCRASFNYTFSSKRSIIESSLVQQRPLRVDPYHVRSIQSYRGRPRNLVCGFSCRCCLREGRGKDSAESYQQLMAWQPMSRSTTRGESGNGAPTTTWRTNDLLAKMYAYGLSCIVWRPTHGVRRPERSKLCHLARFDKRERKEDREGS